jgi:hypothetical protein
MKKSWRDVTIDEYFNLVDRLSDEGLTEYEREVILVSFVMGVTEDKVWDMTIGEFKANQLNTAFMKEFNVARDCNFKTIQLAGEKYDVCTDLHNFTVAQYIDFQTFYAQRKDNANILASLLACFIIPRGHGYAEGYDVNDLKMKIINGLDILTAEELLFFFLKRYLLSMRATANYFNWAIRRLKRKGMPTGELEARWEEVKKATLDGLRSLTTSVGSLGSLGTASFEKTSTSSLT